MKNYIFLIIDLDDTLLDFQDTEIKALEVIFKKYSVPFEDHWINQYRAINKELWTHLEKGIITKNEIFNQRFERFFRAYGIAASGRTAEEEYRNHLNTGHKLLPEALETLASLKNKGYTLLAGTNGVGKTQRQRLSDSQLQSYFDDLFISEEVGYEKPNPAFYKIIFNKYPEMTLENTLMIGDSLSSDIQGAINVGIDSIWFNPKGVSSALINPTYEISTLNELSLILNK